MGLLSYFQIALKSWSEASHSITNCLVKSGRAVTGGLATADLSCWKANQLGHSMKKNSFLGEQPKEQQSDHTAE